MSILVMVMAGSLIDGLMEAVKAGMEWKYKRTHNKRREYH